MFATVRRVGAAAWRPEQRDDRQRPLMLLVDDDEVFRERLARALRERGYEVVTAADDDEALRGGARATRRLRGRRSAHAGDDRARAGRASCCALQPQPRVVVLTGYGSIASAVEAMRLGAHDYVSKPADADDVLAALTGEGAAPCRRPDRRAASAPSLARAEWEHIQRILADTGGNVSEAARRLGSRGARCS